MPKKFDIVLPKPNEKIPARLKNPRILLLYSEPKMGKTSLAAQLKDSLLIDLENEASDYVDATKVSVNSLEELNYVGGEIIKAGKPYKYGIIDTASQLADWCQDDATSLYKKSVIGSTFKGEDVVSELPKGAGYYWHRKSYGIYFEGLRNCFPVLIVLAHVKDKMIVDKKGKEVEASDVDLLGKLKQITCAKADAIGYMYRKTVGAEEGKPVEEVMISFHAGGVNAGSRSRHLAGEHISLSTVVSGDKAIIAHWDRIFLPEGEIDAK